MRTSRAVGGLVVAEAVGVTFWGVGGDVGGVAFSSSGERHVQVFAWGATRDDGVAVPRRHSRHPLSFIAVLSGYRCARSVFQYHPCRYCLEPATLAPAVAYMHWRGIGCWHG